jgi:hypothetical protein
MPALLPFWPGPSDTDTKTGRISALLGPLIVALVFGLSTWLSWRRWPDFLIDYGRELYVPWRLLQGDMLYRDIAYFNGPLSPYLNFLWFKIFGVSFLTLSLCNIFMTIILCGIIYYITKQISDEFTAILSCIAFIVIFAFGHIIKTGNFNFISPYSHEMTHGIILSFIVLLIYYRLAKKFSFLGIFFLGLLLGLIFLGKGEIFLAAALATMVGMPLIFLAHHCSRGRILLSCSLFCISFLLPFGVALAAFSSEMPVDQALKNLLGFWIALFKTQVSNNLYYKTWMGLDRPWQRIFIMMRQLAGLICLIAGVVLFGIRKKYRHTIWFFLLLIMAAFLIKKKKIPFVLSGIELPFIMFFIIIAIIIMIYKNKIDNKTIDYLILLIIWAILGIGLLAKIIFNANLYHYGFALAVPAVTLFTIIIGYGNHILNYIFSKKYNFFFFIIMRLLRNTS